MLRARLVFAALVLLHCESTGKADKLPDDARAILEKAEQLELFSLEGSTRDDKGYHGWKILGQTTVKKEDRAKLQAAFLKGVADNKGKAAFCFIPRHGIRGMHNGKTADFVICFECFQVRIYINDKEAKGTLVTDSPQPAFDKILKDAKVTLPKK